MDEQRGNIGISHLQYWIADFDAVDALTLATYKSNNGLVEVVTDSLAVILTGTEFGPLDLRVQWHESQPDPGGDDWSEIVEFSLEFEDDEIGGICTPNDVGVHQFSHVQHLAGAGWYRFRVHARGRDHAHEVITVDGAPRETHLVQVWQAPCDAVVVVRNSDHYGASIRAR